ncbi:unnamed protein product, partial [Cylicocyclus nassatus]
SISSTSLQKRLSLVIVKSYSKSCTGASIKFIFQAKMLQEELTETTVEDKLRRLCTFFTAKSFEQIDMTFDLTVDINVDRGYFLEMMAGAITFHFGIQTDASTLEQFQTLGDIANYIHSNQS